MRMKARERWNCMNPACGCQVVVEIGGEVEGRNPRCACGEIMKKKYTSPAAAYLHFLHLDEPAEAQQREPGKSHAHAKVWLRNFRGLALLLVVVLFVLGAYLIAKEFTNPLASPSAGLVRSSVTAGNRPGFRA